MINDTNLKWDTRFLSFIYILLTASLVYALSSSSGCSTQEDDLGGNSLGAETNMQEVAQAYFEILAEKHPLELRKGQSTLYEGNQRIDMGATLKFFDIDRWVTNSVLDANQLLTIYYTYEETSYDQYGSIIEKPGPADDKIEIDLRPDSVEPNANNVFQSKLSNYPSLQELLTGQLKAVVIRQLNPVEKNLKIGSQDYNTLADAKVTYHSLVVKDRTQKVPSKVSNKPNCGDVKDCLLNVRQIEFDVAQWTSNTDWKKTHITWIISPDVPSYVGGLFNGFGGFVSQCSAEKIAVKDNASGKQNEYLVSSCPQVLRDFSWHREL